MSLLFKRALSRINCKFGMDVQRMANLSSKLGDVSLTLRPYRLSEEGRPTWVLTQLELTHDGRKLMSTTLSVTKDDLVELLFGLRGLLSNGSNSFSITTTDEDLIIQAQTLDSEGDVAVGYWFGEPYVLMQGYRFVTTTSSLHQFVSDLELEEKAVA